MGLLFLLLFEEGGFEQLVVNRLVIGEGLGQSPFKGIDLFLFKVEGGPKCLQFREMNHRFAVIGGKPSHNFLFEISVLKLFDEPEEEFVLGLDRWLP